jgi:hypothetical protein
MGGKVPKVGEAQNDPNIKYCGKIGRENLIYDLKWGAHTLSTFLDFYG